MESKVSSLSDGRSDVYLLPHRSPSPSYHSPSPSHRSPSPSPPSWSTGFRWLSIRGRRLLFATCACLAAASLFGLMSMMLWSYQSKSQVVLDHENQLSGVAKPKVDEWGPLSVLRGPATDSLWDNLQNDTKYITSWPSAGWTNDVMTYANLIYLARLTERVAVIPPFIPSHIGGEAGSISFGRVFNTTRLGQSIGIPVVEWQDVKKPDTPMRDDMGCWDIWEASQPDEHGPRGSWLTHALNLDISFTRAPKWIKLVPNDDNDKHTGFMALASLGFPHVRDEELVPPYPSEEHKALLPPSLHFLCYDYLYYVAAVKPFEYSLDYSPAWRFSARYMRWTDHLEQLAEKYVRKTLDVAEGLPTPFYIAIHVRHGDFKVYCEKTPLKDCFAPLPVIARRVREIQEELLSKQGPDVKHVIMTSDEQDPEWWAEVKKLGWKTPDHSKTEELYGRWYPLLIDAVIQSGGKGFVGTHGSTMSELAMRRCETWHNGAVRMVKWGHIGSDDH